MQLSLPPARFDEARASLAAAVVAGGAAGAAYPGRVVSESTSARDATAEYVDVVARERSQQKALAQASPPGGMRPALLHLFVTPPPPLAPQLEVLMRAAANAAEALNVYSSMQQFAAQLEAASARRKHLEHAAAAATFHVTLQAS